MQTIVIPGYDIGPLIGQGGMGQVYQATDTRLGRPVAIKLLNDTRDRELVERFEAEARAIASLSHPNVTRLFEYARSPSGQPYCVLEFISGGSLAQQMKGKLASPKLAAEIVATLARAVHSAHAHGILHRDLKPSNVLIDGHGQRDQDGAAETIRSTPDSVTQRSRGLFFSRAERRSQEVVDPQAAFFVEPSRLRIADFGLARRIDSDSHVTRTGQVIGTPAYMAPEQASGVVTNPGPGVDIYSLGAILYELLTGRPPFLGADAIETLMLLMSADVIPPREIRKTVPRDLSTICLKCLERKRSRRYLSAVELAEDLDRFLSDRPILARPASTWEKAVKWTMRNPWKGTALATLGAAMIAFSIGFQMLRSTNTKLTSANEEIKRTNLQLSRTNEDLQNTVELAKDSLNGVVTNLRDQLGDVPHANSLMMQTASKALDLQRRLHQLQPDNLSVARSYANALYEQQMLHWFYGDRSESKKMLDELSRAIPVLVRKFPEDVQLRVLEIKAIREEATFDPSPDEQRSALRQRTVDEKLTELLAQHSGSAEVARLALMNVMGKVSQAEAEGDFEKQLALANETVTLAERHIKLETRETELEFAYVWLADSRKRVASALQNLNRLAEAETELQTTIAKLEDRFRDDLRPSIRNELADLYKRLGTVLTDGEKVDAAADAFRVAVDSYRQLTSDFPNDNDFVSGLADSLIRSARLSVSVNDTSVVMPMLTEADSLITTALKRSPEDAWFQQLRREADQIRSSVPPPH